MVDNKISNSINTTVASHRDEIKLAGIEYNSLVNGPGMRRVFFTQGCVHNCPGCQNPSTHDFAGGEYRNMDALIKDIAEDPILRGVTFSGGDPFEQADKCFYMAKSIRAMRLSIWCYTGYTYEEIINSNNQDWLDFLNQIDVLVDGPFIQSLMSDDIKFRGSSNQRVIDVQESLKQGNVITIDVDNPDNRKYWRD